MKKINFQIQALGCKVSQYDAAILRRELERRNFQIGPNPKLIIINTCTVTHKAITKDRQLVKHLRRQFPDSLLVIMGCWPQTDKQAASTINSDKTLFWGVGNLEALINKILYFFPVSKNNTRGKILESGIDYSQPVTSDRGRYFLKIGDGCNQFCSYCIIPFARGRLTSRSSKEIFLEAQAAVNLKYQEIVLSGIHLGRYGEDKNGQEKNLSALIKKLLEIKKLTRIRLSSIEINEVTPELISLLKTNPRICPHLHISLQSGQDKILQAMHRPYTSKYFAERVALIRKSIPDIAISTDIIVGFPGETLADFKASYNFAKKMAFSKIHVFSFSAHRQTPAFKLSRKVSPMEIKRRSKKLRELSEELEKGYKQKILQKFKGKKLSIIIEHSRSSRVHGKTKFSFDLEGPLKKDLKSLFKEKDISGDELVGKLIEVQC